MALEILTTAITNTTTSIWQNRRSDKLTNNDVNSRLRQAAAVLSAGGTWAADGFRSIAARERFRLQIELALLR